MVIAEIVELLSEKSQRLKELRAQSPEVEEALKVADEYHQLLNDLEKMCQPAPPVYVPYPVYPSLPYCQPYRLYTSDRTITIQ